MDEITVTPEMVEAAIRSLAEMTAGYGPSISRSTVRRMIAAALEVA